MKTRNSALYALGLAAAITLGASMSAGAQATTTTTTKTKTTKTTTRTRRAPRKRVAPAQAIPMHKDVPMQAMHDTVIVTRVDTITVRGRTDTVTTTMMRYDTVTRMVYPPLAPLPGVFFGLGAGSDIPMNNIRAVLKDSYAGQAQLGIFPGTSPIGIRGDVTYGQLHARDTDCPNCKNPKLFTAGGDLILRMPLDRTSHINPVLYVFGGGGYSKLSDVDPRQTLVINVNGGANLIDKSSAYYDFGPGIDFTLAGLRFYAEGKYMTLLSGDRTGTTNQNKIHLFPVFGGLKFNF